MRICTTCVNPETRPGLQFNDKGQCPVCERFSAEHKGEIDWAARDKELQEIIEWGRENSQRSYDCIVPVSGGKDSTKQAVYARDELGLKPLLVSVIYPPEQLHHRGAANLANLMSLGFDTICVGLNPNLWKSLMRQAFRVHCNWTVATEIPLYSIPIHVSIAYGIPLVFLGENPVFTIGEMESSMDGDATRMKYCNTLMGGKIDSIWLDEMTRQDAYFYNYPDDEEMEWADIRLVYLGYYIREWSGRNNAKFAVERGLQTREKPPEEIGDLYGHCGLDEDFRLVNQMLKYLKLGYGFVTDLVCEDISEGRMDRETGIELVKKYDGRCHPRYIEAFCEYLEITEEEFWEVAERFRNRDIFYRSKNGDWALDVEY